MNEKEKLLLNEAKLTCSMLGNGLNSLRKSSILNVGLYYQSFFSLSIGIERLLKIIIIIKYRCENNGFFPTSEEIKVKSFGHNIIKLIDFLDIKIENEIELKILEFLNNFSKKSRYFNIDGIINENIDYENPLHSWKKIQEDILKIIKKGKKRYEIGIFIPNNIEKFKLSKNVYNVLIKATSYDRNNRYKSIKEFHNAFIMELERK